MNGYPKAPLPGTLVYERLFKRREGSIGEFTRGYMMFASHPAGVAQARLWQGFFVVGTTLAVTSNPCAQVPGNRLPPPAPRQIDFVKEVQPIFQRSCYSCHGREKQRNNFRLDVKERALKGGDIGVDILPGNSAGSPLIHYVAGLVEDLVMPKKGDPLTAEQIGVLRAWIDQGAPWPEEKVQADSMREHWAFRPALRHPLPATKNRAWPMFRSSCSPART